MVYRRMSGMPAWDAGSPLAEMERIRRQMDRLFEGWPSGYASRPAGVFPPINLTEDKDSFFIRAELPGVASKDLDIQATSDSISIGGERKIRRRPRKPNTIAGSVKRGNSPGSSPCPAKSIRTRSRPAGKMES